MGDITQAVDAASPHWRGRLHTWAFLVALPAGFALVSGADGSTARLAAAVYGVSLAAVFGVSAAYHRLPRSASRRLLMRRLDHSMIFLLIAGTYTPVCLLALPAAWGIPLLLTVWAGAVTGILAKVTNFARFGRSTNALYLILGWAALAASPAIISHVSTAEIVLMTAGGLSYTIGAVVLFRRRPDPSPARFGYHEVWHACTLLAGACHFGMVWLLTVGPAA